MTKFVEVRIKSNSKEAVEVVLEALKQFEVTKDSKIMPTDQGGWHVFCNLLVGVTDNAT